MDQTPSTSPCAGQKPLRPVRATRLLRIAAICALAGCLCATAIWIALHFVPLPAALDQSPAVSILFTDRNGEPIREGPTDGHYARPALPLEQIPPRLREATLAAEDKRFYSHGGVDPLALARAAFGQFGIRRTGERRSGASTIAEQLIKLAQPRPRTVWSKIVEAVQAIRLEQVWSKDQILAAYLNRLDYGNLDIGCSAAARHYFGKRPLDLSAAECAFLAALPQSPTRLNPYHHTERARNRQRWILQRMADSRNLPADELARARMETLRLRPRARPFDAPHFAGLLVSRRDHAALAAAAGPAGELRTTVDLGLNHFIADRLRQHLAGLRDQHVGNGAAVVIDNRTAEVIALVGSVDFFGARGGQIDGAWARRSPGSTIKPFTYLLAFENGATPADIVADLPVEYPTRSAIYKPENYSHRYYGPMRLRLALANSLNISAVKVLADKAGGPPALLQTLRNCGLTTLPFQADHYGLGLTLGNSEARLLELTNAYACLARLGEFRPYRLLCPVGGREDAPERRNPLCDPRAAYLVADILADNGARALSFGVDSNLHWDFPVACKTGTSTDFRDNWAIGYTPEFTVGIWVGNFSGKPMVDVSGVTGAGPLLHEIFERLHAQRGTGWYEMPPGVVERTVHRVTGRLLSGDRANDPSAVTEKFLAEYLPMPESASDYDARGRVILGEEYAGWLLSGDNWLGQGAAPMQDPFRIVGAANDQDPAGAKPPAAGETPFKVVSPMPGTTYVLDPDLPASSSLIDLRVTGCVDPQWQSATLECKLVKGRPTAVLREGRHALRVQNPDTGLWRETWIMVKAL